VSKQVSEHIGTDKIRNTLGTRSAVCQDKSVNTLEQIMNTLGTCSAVCQDKSENTSGTVKRHILTSDCPSIFPIHNSLYKGRLRIEARDSITRSV
jgi:hypothetical protein